MDRYNKPFITPLDFISISSGVKYTINKANGSIYPTPVQALNILSNMVNNFELSDFIPTTEELQQLSELDPPQTGEVKV